MQGNITLESEPVVNVVPLGARTTARLASIDVVRGVVIALMALDHVRDFFTDARISPLDIGKTDALLFLTRWITHFCAPTFVFLAGVSAYLMSRQLDRSALSRFLLIRGAWLVLLEVTLVRFLWMFNLDYSQGLFLQVIWVIGVSMIVLAALVYLPRREIGIFGALLIIGHNWLDGFNPASIGLPKALWAVLHAPGPTPIGFVAYSLIPWVGVMALGFAIGSIYDLDVTRRRRIWLQLGCGFIVAFVALRALSLYGDPSPWSVQPSAVMTLLSFLNVTKYPPSLLYLLMTLGPMMLALAALESASPSFGARFAVFGRVPLFAYVAHLALAHLLAGALGAMQGFGAAILTAVPFPHYPNGYGVNLAGVYLAWAIVLMLLYPACAWFAALKRRRRDPWLAYL